MRSSGFLDEEARGDAVVEDGEVAIPDPDMLNLRPPWVLPIALLAPLSLLVNNEPGAAPPGETFESGDEGELGELKGEPFEERESRFKCRGVTVVRLAEEGVKGRVSFILAICFQRGRKGMSSSNLREATRRFRNGSILRVNEIAYPDHSHLELYLRAVPCQ